MITPEIYIRIITANTVLEDLKSDLFDVQNLSKNFIIAFTILVLIFILIIGELLIIEDTSDRLEKIEAAVKPLIIGGLAGSVAGTIETILGKNDLRGITMGLGTGITGIQILSLLDNLITS